MLNKLSFNLAKELNESETKNNPIKKKVFMEGSKIIKENLKEVKISFECPECGYTWTQNFKDYFEDEDDLNDVFEFSSIECPECGGDCQGESYEIIKESLTESDKSIDNIVSQLISGDKLYFRDSEGKALYIQYANGYENPEDYDEGYITGWNKGEDEEYDKEQEEKFQEAKTAAENGDVWEACECDEEGNYTGVSIGYMYGEKELKDFITLEGLREVKMISKLEEKALKEDDYSLARPWSTALINYCENYGVDIWEEELRSLINYLPDDTIGNFLKSEYPNGISKPEDFYPGEIDESSLNEKYSEKLGGDSEDFVSDVTEIKNTLESINTDSFGTHLAQQMVWDWIETCDYQIDRGNRLTKGEFNECDKSLKEGFSTDKVQIVDTCERRGQPIALVNLSQIKPWEEYVVAFGYTTENNEISWDYGYYYYDEESAKQAFEKVKAGGNLSESEKTEKKPIVEAAETEVKDLQVIKEQGNIYMLEDKSEGTRYIVGENYNLSEGEIENAEIYDSKEEADKDYLNRCDIIKDGEEFSTEEDSKEDINEEVEHTTGIKYDFVLSIPGLMPVQYGLDQMSVEDAKKDYIENEGKGHSIDEIEIEYLDECDNIKDTNKPVEESVIDDIKSKYYTNKSIKYDKKGNIEQRLHNIQKATEVDSKLADKLEKKSKKIQKKADKIDKKAQKVRRRALDTAFKAHDKIKSKDKQNESDESLRQISEEEKINNLKMMDNVARKVNDEDLFYGYWLSLGVPDGATEEDYEDIAKEDYKEIEEVFKKLMNKALEDGLYNASEEELEFARKYEPDIKNIE